MPWGCEQERCLNFFEKLTVFCFQTFNGCVELGRIGYIAIDHGQIKLDIK